MKIDKTIIRYFGSGLLLFLIWYFVYDLWLQPQGSIDEFFNKLVAWCSYGVLQSLGYNSCLTGTEICINNEATVRIGEGCNGLELYALFAGFIIIFPGSWKKKLIYIPLGILLIFLLNIGRVTMLSIDNYAHSEWFEFNHKYTYLFIIYLIIFFMWILWVNKFSSLAKK